MDTIVTGVHCHDCHLYHLSCSSGDTPQDASGCVSFMSRSEGLKRELDAIDRVVQFDKVVIATLGCIAAAGIVWTELLH